MLPKQDRQGVRRPADVESKYGLGKLKRTVEDFDKKISQNEIFRELTDNGKKQGVFETIDGQVYINAEYIVSLSAMFAKNITMTGTFESVARAYLPPTQDDVRAISDALLYPTSTYRIDLNGDGVFDERDVQLARDLYLGNVDYSSCPGLSKTPVTLRINMSDTDKTIHISGTNMWGSYVETWIGANPGRSSFAMKDHLDSMFTKDPYSENIYRIVDGEIEWLNPPMEQTDVLYRTYERFMGAPVYTMLVLYENEVPDGYTVIRKSDTISHYFGDFIQVWLIPNDSGE